MSRTMISFRSKHSLTLFVFSVELFSSELLERSHANTMKFSEEELTVVRKASIEVLWFDR